MNRDFVTTISTTSTTTTTITTSTTSSSSLITSAHLKNIIFLENSISKGLLISIVIITFIGLVFYSINTCCILKMKQNRN